MEQLPRFVMGGRATVIGADLHVQAKWRPGGVLPTAWGRVPDWITRRGLAYVEQGRMF